MSKTKIERTVHSHGRRWRVLATIDRLISKIPSACAVLEEEGYVSLAGQLRRDRDNLVYWQENGELTFTSVLSKATKEKGG